MMYRQQQVPHHLLPVPRPSLPGLTFHYSDMPVAIWAVIWTALALFAAWYGLFYAHYADDAVGAFIAAGGFGLLAAIFVVWWVFRIGRRKRIFVYGRAVQGQRIADANVMLRTRYGANVGTLRYGRVSFDGNKIVVVSRFRGDPTVQPIVYVLDGWAGIYEPGSIVAAKWHSALR